MEVRDNKHKHTKGFHNEGVDGHKKLEQHLIEHSQGNRQLALIIDET